MLEALLADAAPLDLRLVGRLLIHATVVGAASGVMAAMFFYALELAEELFLNFLAGFNPLNAAGELEAAHVLSGKKARPWLILVLPALGAGLGSWLTRRYAPECAGPGADATIAAFHQKVSDVRRRVMWIKPIATLLTLGTGGAGGREGPTMQICGAIGSTVARILDLDQRERRILLVAGMAAGVSAIFRTPLGAALLSIELLYRDDFESDALVPAVLASVVGYSVFIWLHGDATLFATAEKYPFIIRHLPLYALMTLVLAAAGVCFVMALRGVRRLSARWPAWARAAIGGLLVGSIALCVLYAGNEGAGMGILGGGYGAAQAAITGADWLPAGLTGAAIMMGLALAKIVASSFTVSTGGSAGVFGPALSIGALVGGAFGYAMQSLTGDPTIQPGAFALVGMGTLYGGIAHAPLGALVMVCEMAGSYDLLVPLMLSGGIAFALLRRTTLYEAQPNTQHDSAAHPPRVLDVLSTLTVKEVIVEDRPYMSFKPGTPVIKMIRDVSNAGWQDVFPIIDDNERLLGMITPELLRLLAAEREIETFLLAIDAMQPAVTVKLDEDLRTASERMLTHGLRELLVVDEDGAICGFIDEAEIGQIYLDRLADE
jgi:CIC family chloride channel protein